MKKLFTLLFCICSAMTASAQTAEFRYHGQPLADGATVTIYSEEDDWGDAACETNPTSSAEAAANGLILANLTGSELRGTAKLTINSNTMATERIQWCMGGECVIVRGSTLDKSFMVKANSFILTQFDAIPTQYGELTATITAMVGLSSLTVNIRFVHQDGEAVEYFPRTSVIEEFTGTWCGNCPRGIVGLKNLARDFGDRCIAIAVHSSTNPNGTDEPMYNSAYHDNGIVPTGIPKCKIDRVTETHPYEGTTGGTHYGLSKDFAAALDVPAEAKIELTAKWENERRNYIVCTATTTFGLSSETAPYAVIFVILEDGLHGEGKEWAQVNYYANENPRQLPDADMDEFYAAPYNITGMEYNHVAIASLGVKNGVAGSIKAPIVKGEAQTYAGRVVMNGNKIMQDPYNLTAVAMLVNTETGAIVNAAKAHVDSFDGDGVEAVESKPAVDSEATYNLQGQRVGGQRLQRGLYVRGGNKILVR
ncbi:MAG: hypothetical protein IJJ94_04815 [Bacteroidaceae bacterium]|nr:hypothetical protein [Bacteroidaceae bacterium]